MASGPHGQKLCGLRETFGGAQASFTELSAAQAEVDRLYARWAELEAKSQ